MPDTINKRIARCRKLANLTQTEAAEKIGMKCSTYSQMERKGSISAEKLLTLAKIFDVDPNVLLYDDYENTHATKLDFSGIPIMAQAQLMQNSNVINDSGPMPFIASKKEENIIKIIRNLPKPVREDILEYIQKKYTENK